MRARKTRCDLTQLWCLFSHLFIAVKPLQMRYSMGTVADRCEYLAGTFMVCFRKFTVVRASHRLSDTGDNMRYVTTYSARQK